MTRILTEADFVDGVAGALFRVSSSPVRPDGQVPPFAAVLMVPPFAEEMNRSRRFLTALRHATARRGAQAWLVDPFGTGDSAGELVDARWDIWVEDLLHAVRALRRRGATSVSLFGLRAGALLAEELAGRLDAPPARIVHVQPERSGADVVRRLLRARVAHARFAGERGDSVDSLWHRLEAGESVELGGYRLGSALALALRERALAPGTAPRAREVSHRFELTGSAAADDDSSGSARHAPAATERPDGGARAADADAPADAAGDGVVWHHHTLPGRPFWQLADSVPDATVVERVAAALVP